MRGRKSRHLLLAVTDKYLSIDKGYFDEI